MTEVTHVPKAGFSPGLTVTGLLITSIALGSFLGLSHPSIGPTVSNGIDPTLLVMVGLLFFEVRLRSVTKALSNLRFIGLAWIANFLLVPMIGFAIASLFLVGQPLVYTGLLIYFLAPCTDWFLSFTRMARGDTVLGAALIPINMFTQLLLLPVWLWLFTRHTGAVDLATIPDTIWQWFLLPFITAQAARWALDRILSKAAFDRICDGVGILIPAVTAILILQIFAANTTAIAAHLDVFGWVLAAIFVFFAATYVMAEMISRAFRLSTPEQTLLAMTTAARNAPLMLVITAIAIPDQPLIYAAIVVGMLVEFPHLTILKQVLLLKAARQSGQA